MSAPTTGPASSVLVPIPSDLARTIDSLAEQRGQDRVQFIVDVLQEQLRRLSPSFADQMAPIAEDFRQSGMTEDELDDLVEQERRAVWDDRRG